jgi:hypothetical protein
MQQVQAERAAAAQRELAVRRTALREAWVAKDADWERKQRAERDCVKLEILQLERALCREMFEFDDQILVAEAECKHAGDEQLRTVWGLLEKKSQRELHYLYKISRAASSRYPPPPPPPPTLNTEATARRALCQLLRIPLSSSVEEIQRARKQQLLRCHPDRGGKTHEARDINDAFDAWKDACQPTRH